MNLWNNEWCIKAIAKNKTKNDSLMLSSGHLAPERIFFPPKKASYIQLHYVNFYTFGDFSTHLVTLVVFLIKTAY